MSNNDTLIDRLRIDDADREQATTRWLWPVIVISLLGVAIAAAWVWYNASRAVEVEVVRPVMIETSGNRPVASVLDASGFVVARRQATVAAEVTGKLTEVLVEEGMRVEQGQVLARIDDATEQARLDLSRARLASEQRAVREIQVRLDDAERTQTRLNQLRARELVSQADLDQADTAFASLRAQLASARQRVEVVRREVALQEQLLDELTVRAPFGGIVIARAAQAGEMVSPISAGGGFTRTGICTIVDMSSLEIEVDVNEAFIDRVSTGQGVVALLDAYPEWEIPAEVTIVVPAADRQKATVRVRIGFVELDPRILPDMGISVRFLDEETAPEPVNETTRSSLPALPAAAIVQHNGAEVVFVVRAGQVERRGVRTAGSRSSPQGLLTVITAGLSANDQVVAHPRELDLEDGDSVRVLD